MQLRWVGGLLSERTGHHLRTEDKTRRVERRSLKVDSSTLYSESCICRTDDTQMRAPIADEVLEALSDELAMFTIFLMSVVLQKLRRDALRLSQVSPRRFIFKLMGMILNVFLMRTNRFWSELFWILIMHCVKVCAIR